MAFKKYFREEWKHFVHSFKHLNRRYILTAMLDAMLYLIIFLSVSFYLVQLQNTFADYQKKGFLELLKQDYTTWTEEALDSATSATKTFYRDIIIYTISLALALLIFFSLFKGLVYSMLLSKRFRLRFYLKFLLVNVIWFVLWGLVYFFIFRLINLNLVVYFGIAATLLLFYLTGLLFTSYAIYENISSGFSKAWQLFKKTHLFVFPYILILVILVVFMLAFKQFPGITAKVISYIIFVCYAAWVRVYVISIAKRLL